MAVDLGTAFGRIVIDGRGANAGLGVAQRGLLTFGKAAGLVFAGIGVAAAVGIGSSVKAAADFEQAMADLGAISGATGARLEQLSEQALDAGASTKFSATEAAAAQLELAKAGLTVEQVLGGGLQGALSLAAAGDIELADAASIAANAINLFGLEASELPGVADALAAAANSTTADVGDFGMALTQGGAAAKAAGLNFNQTVGFLEALALAGVKNSDAGTSMKAAILQLINPTDKQAQLTKQLGLELFTANGQLKDGAGIAQELRGALGKQTQAERARTLAILAGSDGMRALLALYDAGPQRIAALERAQLKEGEAARVAAARQDSLAGALEELGGSVETLQIRFGRLLIPVLRDGAEALVGIVNAASGSNQLEAFGSGLADGIRAGVTELLALGQQALPVLVQLGTVGADAFRILAATAQGAGPVLGVVATAAITTVGAVLALVSPVVSLAAAIAELPGVTQLAAAALVGLGAAFATIRIAAIIAPVASLIGLFASLAATAGVAAAGTTALGIATARLGAVMAFATGPVGLAAFAIGAITAGVVALASGMFSGRSSAEVLADAMGRVATAADAAAGAVRNMDGAVNRLADTQLGAKDAALRVKEAEAELARIRSDPASSPLQQQRAELNLQRARQDSTRATQAAAGAQRAAGAQASKSVQQLIELATAQGDATKTAEQQDAILRTLGSRLGLTAAGTTRLSDDLDKLRAGSGTTAQRLEALQAAAGRAAKGIKGTGPAAQDARRQLEAIAKASPGQLEQYVSDIQGGVKRGQTRAQAGKAAIQRLLVATGDVSVPMGSFVGSIRSGVSEAEAVARAGAARIRAALRSANADERQSPSANDVITASLGRTENITRRGLAKVLNTTRGGVDAILETEQSLAAGLEAIDARNEQRERAAERRRLTSAANRGLSSDFTADDRRQAQGELARFNAEERRRRQRLPVELARDSAAAVQGALGGLESALGTIGQRAGEAIDRSLRAAVAQVEEGLRATLASIASSPEAQRITAIGTELEAARTARSARDADRQRGTLGATAATADALVARRQAGLAAARTESERQAAQALLDSALAAQRDAGGALADFEEDQRLARLEAERAGLEASLQQQRDAATKAAEDRRVALEADATAQRAALDKQLGDLAENLRQRPKAWRKYVTELQGILGDPKLSAQLEASGRELGLSFSRGLDRAVSSAEQAAEGMAKSIARYLRLRSPAEAGPLRYDFARAGETIGGDLAAGMANRRRAVESEARRLASAATLAGARGGGADQGDGATTGGGGGNTYNVTVPAERPVEDPRTTANRLGWELAHGGGAR